MTRNDKLKIINRIKKHIQTERNGYAGVIWASKNVFGKDFVLRKYQIESIASIITESGKYRKEEKLTNGVKDFYIYKNSDSNWFKRNPWLTEVFRFVITVGTALLIPWLKPLFEALFD